MSLPDSSSSNQFWCNQCRKEFHENEVERREGDTESVEEGWWYCRACGTALLQLHPAATDEDAQKLFSLIKQRPKTRESRRTSPFDDRFWCDRCQREFRGNEVEKRNVDTMFGDGRWWYCKVCGAALEQYPDIGERDKR